MSLEFFTIFLKTVLQSVYWSIYLEQGSLVYICPKHQILANLPDTCKNLPSSSSGNAETLYSNTSHSVLPVISITSALFPNGKTPLTSSSDIGSKKLDRNHLLFPACWHMPFKNGEKCFLFHLKNSFRSRNHKENEAGRLVLDLFLFLKKALY